VCTKCRENGLSFDFFRAIPQRWHEFLNHITGITGTEIWVSFVNIETKQTKQWIHTHSPSKVKKFKQLLTVFWDMKGVLMLEFMQQGATIMPEVYCEKIL
jgi:hypothetical protein